VGKVVSAAVVGVMVHKLTPRMCFQIVAVLPFLVALSSFVMREERTPCCGGRRRMTLTSAHFKACTQNANASCIILAC